MTPETLERRYLTQLGKSAQRQNVEETFRVAQKAIDLNTNFYLFYEMRGLAYSTQGKFDKAIEDYNKAIALCPDDPESYCSLYSGRGHVWQLLDEHKSAIEDFNNAIAAMSDSDLYHSRGDCYFALGKYHEAIEDYNKALSLRPDSRAYTARGKTLAVLQQYDDARSALDNATRIDQYNHEAHLVLGNMYLVQKHYTAAVEAYNKAISLITEDHIGPQLESPLVSSEATYDLYEALIIDLAGAFADRSICHSRLGNNTKALEDIGAAIGLLPTEASLYVLRSIIYLEMEDHSKALEELTLAIEHDSISSEPFFIRAMLHVTQAAYQEAIEDINRAIILSRDSGLLYLTRGNVRLRVGEYELAISDFNRVNELELDTSLREIRGGLHLSFTQSLGAPSKYSSRALAYALLGNEAMARSDFYNAIELGLRQAEIEEEISELLSEDNDRRLVADLVRRIFTDGPAGIDGQMEASASGSRTYEARMNRGKDLQSPMSKEWKTLSKEQYISLFRDLSFYDISAGKTLKHQVPIPSIYFNCKYGVVSFVVYTKDKHRFSPNLWKQIAPQRRKDAKAKLMTVLPRAGREYEAFKQILI